MSAAPEPALGQLGFEVRDPDAWARLATDVLGLAVVDRDERGFYLRMDDHHHRIRVDEGPADDLAFCGWEVPDLAPVIAALDARGVTWEEGSPAACALRRVERLVRFLDPAGIPVEAHVSPARAPTPFTSPLVRSGFKTGPLGLGHCVLAARDVAESVAFYGAVLGLRYSDRVATTIHGHVVDITFLHANPRHHSVAFPAPPGRRIHHFLLEVGAMDDVGLAFSRACAAGVEIVLTLGRHPNDRMFSFYARTPSGIEFEYGWGGVEIDDATWKPEVHRQISEWGHIPPAFIPRVKERR